MRVGKGERIKLGRKFIGILQDFFSISAKVTHLASGDKMANIRDAIGWKKAFYNRKQKEILGLKQLRG